MYDRVVAVPRLLAGFPEAGEVPLLQELGGTLSAHYGRPIRPAHAALYRAGRDSVAMHSDHVGPARKLDSVVAILSLGEPRPFHLKPAAGGPLRAWRLGWGDLLVLGGRIQADFLHGVPKVASALPRMSVMFRDGPPSSGSGG
jgi:alkylated DNA repair dioxygenase AlkB